MKKLLPFVILLCFACSKEKNETFSIDQSDVSLKHDETIQLTTSPPQSCSWISNDVTRAKVSQTGLVTAGFVGDTKITAQSASGSLVDVCNIHITPMSLLYTEPYRLFGASVSTIKSKEKRIIFNESSTSVIYYGENTNVRYVLYTFESTGLTSTDVMLANETSVATELATFIDERYEFVGDYDGAYFFEDIDGSMAVISVDDTLGLNVMYFMPTSGAKKGSGNFVYEFKVMKGKMRI
jgi:hypothetical protein